MIGMLSGMISEHCPACFGFRNWGTIFSGPAASAILDRLSFNGKFIVFEGDTYRPHIKKSK